MIERNNIKFYLRSNYIKLNNETNVQNKYMDYIYIYIDEKSQKMNDNIKLFHKSSLLRFSR